MGRLSWHAQERLREDSQPSRVLTVCDPIPYNPNPAQPILSSKSGDGKSRGLLGPRAIRPLWRLSPSFDHPSELIPACTCTLLRRRFAWESKSFERTKHRCHAALARITFSRRHLRSRSISRGDCAWPISWHCSASPIPPYTRGSLSVKFRHQTAAIHARTGERKPSRRY
jgi:hypothetical protein